VTVIMNLGLKFGVDSTEMSQVVSRGKGREVSSQLRIQRGGRYNIQGSDYSSNHLKSLYLS